MKKGCIKMLLNILFSAINDRSPFEEKIDFEKIKKKPEKSVFTVKIVFPKDDDNDNDDNYKD